MAKKCPVAILDGPNIHYGLFIVIPHKKKQQQQLRRNVDMNMNE